MATCKCGKKVGCSCKLKHGYCSYCWGQLSEQEKQQAKN